MLVSITKEQCLGEWLAMRRLLPDNWMQLLRAVNTLVKKAWPDKALHDADILTTDPHDASACLKVRKALKAAPFQILAVGRRWQLLACIEIPALKKRQTELKRRSAELSREQDVAGKRVAAAAKSVAKISSQFGLNILAESDLHKALSMAIDFRAAAWVEELGLALQQCNQLIVYHKEIIDAVNAYMVLKEQPPYLEVNLPCVYAASSESFDMTNFYCETWLTDLYGDCVELESFVSGRLGSDWVEEKSFFGDEMKTPDITRETAEVFRTNVQAVKRILEDQEKYFYVVLRESDDTRESYIKQVQSAVRLVNNSEDEQKAMVQRKEETVEELGSVCNSLERLIAESTQLKESLVLSFSALVECSVAIEAS